MNNRKIKKKKTALSYIVLFSACVLLYCVVRMMVYTISGMKAEAGMEVLRRISSAASDKQTEDEALYADNSTSDSAYSTYTSGPVLSKYESLHDMNNDMVGWLSIDGTSIDYPVMQTVYDGEYYISHDFYKEDYKGGVPFIDSRCSLDDRSTNLLIYGHNMKNGSMFHDLLKYEDSDFYKEHRYIKFDTLYEEATYEIVAVFRTRVAYQGEDAFRFYNFIEADSDHELTKYLLTIDNLSLYDIEATAESSDELITLTTCEYSEPDGRFVVVARKLA